MATKPLALPASYVLTPHRQLRGALAPGVTTTNGTAIAEPICIAGARFVTIRFKSASAGTLQWDYVRPEITDTGAQDLQPIANYLKYTSPASPASVAIVANTENSLQFTTNGEHFGILTFTPSTTATMTYCDVCAV